MSLVCDILYCVSSLYCKRLQASKKHLSKIKYISTEFILTSKKLQIPKSAVGLPLSSSSLKNIEYSSPGRYKCFRTELIAPCRVFLWYVADQYFATLSVLVARRVQVDVKESTSWKLAKRQPQ